MSESETLFPADAWDNLPEENVIRVPAEVFDRLVDELNHPPRVLPKLLALMREPDRFVRAEGDTLPQHGPGKGNTKFHRNEEDEMPL